MSVIFNTNTTLYSIPIGTIISFGAEKNKQQDNSWILCEGKLITKADYPELYDVIGFTWGGIKAGPNDDQIFFNVPDLRGYFLRGVDNTNLRDKDAALRGAQINTDPIMNPVISNPGNSGLKVGSIQKDGIKNHYHVVHARVTDDNSGNDLRGGSNSLPGRDSTGRTLENYDTDNGDSNSSKSETRPYNAYVFFYIKAK